MRKLMVVEDSAAMRGLIASILEQIEGAEVVEVSSGFDALKRLPVEPVDLIVMDINMPDINGLELLSFVRRSAAHADTPVVIVTTEGSESDRQRGMDLGANAYLVKPFESGALLDTVRRLLGEAP